MIRKSFNEIYDEVGVDRFDTLERQKQIPLLELHTLAQRSRELDQWLAEYRGGPSSSRPDHTVVIEQWKAYLLTHYILQNQSSPHTITNHNDLIFQMICQYTTVMYLPVYSPRVTSLSSVSLSIQVLIDTMTRLALVACQAKGANVQGTPPRWPEPGPLQALLYDYAFLLTIYTHQDLDRLAEEFQKEETLRLRQFKERVQQEALAEQHGGDLEEEQKQFLTVNQALEDTLDKIDIRYLSLMQPSPALLDLKDQITCRLIPTRAPPRYAPGAEPIVPLYRKWNTPIETGMLFTEVQGAVLHRLVYIPCAILTEIWSNDQLLARYPCTPLPELVRTAMTTPLQRFHTWMTKEFFAIEQPEELNHMMISLWCELHLPLGTRLWIKRDLTYEFTPLASDILFQKSVGASLGIQMKIPFEGNTGSELKTLAHTIQSPYYDELCLAVFSYQVWQDTNGEIPFLRDYLISGSQVLFAFSEKNHHTNWFTRSDHQGIPVRPFLVQLHGKIYLYYQEHWEGPYESWLVAVIRWLGLVRSPPFRWKLTDLHTTREWKKRIFMSSSKRTG